MAEAYARMSPELFQQIVDAFRENNWSHASYGKIGRIVGLDQRRISQAWREGFAAAGLPSILNIATEEMRTGVKWRHPSIKSDLPISPFQGGPHQGGPLGTVPSAGPPAPPPAPPPPAPAAPAAPAPAPAAPPPPVTGDIIPPPAPVQASKRKGITKEDINEHAQDALTAELRAIAAVRDAAIGAAISARKILGSLQGRIDRMAEDVAREDASGAPVDRVELTKTLHRILIVAEKASQITEQTIKAERLALGSPTEIIKATIASAPTVDAEAAALERSKKVLEFLAGRKKAAPALASVAETSAEECSSEDEDEPEPLEIEAENDEAEEEDDEVERDPEEAVGDIVE